MPIAFNRVYLESAGYFMPGEPVSNEAMDSYIAVSYTHLTLPTKRIV